MYSEFSWPGALAGLAVMVLAAIWIGICQLAIKFVGRWISMGAQFVLLEIVASEWTANIVAILIGIMAAVVAYRYTIAVMPALHTLEFVIVLVVGILVATGFRQWVCWPIADRADDILARIDRNKTNRIFSRLMRSWRPETARG